MDPIVTVGVKEMFQWIVPNGGKGQVERGNVQRCDGRMLIILLINISIVTTVRSFKGVPSHLIEKGTPHGRGPLTHHPGQSAKRGRQGTFTIMGRRGRGRHAPKIGHETEVHDDPQECSAHDDEDDDDTLPTANCHDDSGCVVYHHLRLPNGRDNVGGSSCLPLATCNGITSFPWSKPCLDHICMYATTLVYVCM